MSSTFLSIALVSFFLMFSPKYQTSKWWRISFRFFLRKQWTCLRLAVIKEAISTKSSSSRRRTCPKSSNFSQANVRNMEVNYHSCLTIHNYMHIIFCIITWLSHLPSPKKSISPRSYTSPYKSCLCVLKTWSIAGINNVFRIL